MAGGLGRLQGFLSGVKGGLSGSGFASIRLSAGRAMEQSRQWGADGKERPLCVLGPGQVSLQLLETGGLGATLRLEVRTLTLCRSFFSSWHTAPLGVGVSLAALGADSQGQSSLAPLSG